MSIVGRALIPVKKMYGLAKLSLAMESYFPESPRKSRFTITSDNVLWYIRNGEINWFYYAYGLDKLNGPRPENFLAIRPFGEIRDRQNQAHREADAHIRILRDKLAFEAFVADCGIRTPQTVAIVSDGLVVWVDGRSGNVASLLETELTAFCKPVDGIMGVGAFLLQVTEGEARINGSPATLQNLVEALLGRYVLQVPIFQHAQLARLHPSSINTLRIVTVTDGGEPRALIVCLRIGTGGRPVDNWASGGLIIRVDPAAGVLCPPAFFKPGKGLSVMTHPDTGVPLTDYRLPFVPEAIRDSLAAHRALYGVHSVGWDVAVTPDGPLLIEGNDNWDYTIPQTLDHTFKDRFLATIG